MKGPRKRAFSFGRGHLSSAGNIYSFECGSGIDEIGMQLTVTSAAAGRTMVT